MFNKLVRIGDNESLVSEKDSEIMKRRIEVNFEINSETASSLCCLLRELNEESNSDITLFINSPGGSVTDGLYIYDTIKSLNCDVVTVACGMTASMGAFLLSCAGTKGKRYALPNSTILIHQVLGGVSGQETDIRIHADYIMNQKKRLNTLLSLATGKDVSKIDSDTERDYFLNATEALSYGLVDHIGMPK